MQKNKIQEFSPYRYFFKGIDENGVLLQFRTFQEKCISQPEVENYENW